MKLLRIVLLLVGVLGAITNSRAATITATRLAPETSGLARGTLFATIDGQERFIARQAWDAWIIAGGKALVWAGADGAGGFENEGQSLWRYDAATGQRRKLMAEQFMIERVREARARSGRTALVVSMRDGGLGAPHLAVVDPQRGEVWRHRFARLSAIRNGRLAIIVLSVKDLETSTDGDFRRLPPAAMLYPEIDALLRRPVMRGGA